MVKISGKEKKVGKSVYLGNMVEKDGRIQNKISHNNRYRSSKNPHDIQEVPWHDLKVRGWCAVSTHKITAFVFQRNNKF